MRRNPARAVLLLTIAAAATLSAAPSQHVLRVRAWRTAHERQILDELMRLVSLPNIASNQADIAKNADLLTAMFEKRGFNVQRITTAGSPLLVARRDAPKAVGSLTFYLHYDGQPTDAKDWTMGAPFAPAAYKDQARVDLAASTGPVNPDVRIYARAVADDKGPIIGLLAAMDGLIDAGRHLAVEPARRARRRGRGGLAKLHGDDEGTRRHGSRRPGHHR